MKIKVKDIYTGEVGTIEDSDLSSRYQKVEATPVQQTSSQTQTTSQIPQQGGGIMNKILSILAPRTQAIGQDLNASGQVGNYVDSMNQNTNQLVSNALALRKANQSGNTQQAQQLAQQGRGISAQPKAVAPEFSQDINKSYNERGAKTGLELGSYLVPAGKTFKTAVGLGAVSGGLKSISNDEKVAGGAIGGAVGAGVMYGLFNLGGKLLSQSGDKLALKGLRPSKSQITKFEGKTGENLTQFVKENKLFQKGTEQVNDKLKVLYNQYDDVAVKSGKKIGVLDLLDKFDDQIDELSKYGGTEFDSIINYLTKEKTAVADKLTGKSEVGLDWLVNNRRQLDKVIPKSSFGADPIAAGSKKIVRDMYKKVIDETTGGVTKTIGGQINKFEAFKDIAKLQKNLGTGNLPVGLMSILSSGAGAGLGYGSGGKNGAIKGALIGAGLTAAANNPKVISSLTKLLTAGGNKASNASGSFIPQLLGRTIGQQVGSLTQNTVNGNQQPNQTPVSELEQNNVDQQQPQNNQGNSIIPPTENTSTQNYLTGKSPEQHYAAYQKAIAAGDKTNAALLYKRFEDETKYQKDNKSTKGNVSSSIDMMEQLYAPGKDNSLSVGDKTVGIGGVAGKANVLIKKQTDQDYADRLNSYKTQMALVAGAINQAAGAGVLNGGEYERLAMESFPNEYTSEKVAKEWFTNARKVLNSLPDSRASELESLLGM
ncbi:hypothetical protein KJ836_02615 [Patescibacteria group bacterium]|nr:hypothetical protein [Patescibacteria group bacterium]